jgi:23S rRNA (uracil1939-C5)-methyltransferase
LEALADTGPQRIVYVSCNPSTLARDLKVLAQLGYRIDEVQPFDMFPHTYHVECVVLMSRL